jgi:phage terminase small subunit
MARPGKPAGLVTRAETKEKKAQRAQKEEALKPKRGLPLNPPARLKDHKTACFIWRKLMRRYNELEAEIVTGMDWLIVENLCLSVDELDQLGTMRTAAYDIWLELAKEHDKLKKEQKWDEAVLMAINVIGAWDAVLKLDGRIDRKKDLVHKLSQSLYINPRSRAGTAPAKKEKEEPPDDLEQLLDDVTDYVNGEGKDVQ